MNIEQLSTMAESELHARANAHLEHLDSTESDMTKEHHVAQAQVYLSELDRRKQAQEYAESERIARRDYKLELWVIVLIGAELVLAIVAIAVGWVEGNQQMGVLDKLNKSSAETAATLTAVRQAQEASLETQKHTLENIVAMNNALQDELDFNFADVLQWSNSTGDGTFTISNRGKANLFLWGSRFGGQPVVMQQKGTVIPIGGSHTFDLSRLSKKLLENVEDTVQKQLPFELYLKTVNGKKYVARSILLVRRDHNNLSLYCESIFITPKEW